MRSLVLTLALLVPGLALLSAQGAPTGALSPAQAQLLVNRALANEVRSADDTTHLMRYRLRKITPRLEATREIYETVNGDVALLLSVNGQPLDELAAQKEAGRLNALAADPGKQRHRKQAEDADRTRATNVIRVLPRAFLYQYAGRGESSAGMVEKFAFRPNPNFSAPDLATQVLTAMSGEIWIEPDQERVVRLEGHLQHDVGFGWGILGRLNKGGWITLDQAEVAPAQWRIVRMQMSMSGRVLFKTRVFDTTQEQSEFVPLPPNMGYREAIEQLEAGAFRARNNGQ